MTTSNSNNIEGIFGCKTCQSTYVLTRMRKLPTCPICGSLLLEKITAKIDPPEIESLSPFNFSKADLEVTLENFIKPIKFKPDSLKVEICKKNLTRVYFPMWLVDSHFSGTWTANFGFDYKVQSAKEYYKNNQWQSETVEETRINWSPRAGTIDTMYQNIITRAINTHQWLSHIMGRFDTTSLTNTNPVIMRETDILVIPDIEEKIAWNDAKKRFIDKTKNECLVAADAQHTKAFSADLAFDQKNWTSCMLPYYVTWYEDDDGTPQPIWINGQSGQIGGVRKSSQQKGTQLGVIAFLISALSLIISIAAGYFSQNNSIFDLIAILFFLVFVSGVVTGIYSFAYPWFWNKRNEKFIFKKT